MRVKKCCIRPGILFFRQLAPEPTKKFGSDLIKKIRLCTRATLLTFPVRHGIKEGPGGSNRVPAADKGDVVAGLNGHHRHQLHEDPEQNTIHSNKLTFGLIAANFTNS